MLDEIAFAMNADIGPSNPGANPMHSEAERVVTVVDDDAAVRNSLRFLLEIIGYRVTTYASAAHFLDEARVDGPACLVVEEHMAEQTGLQLISHLRGQGVRLPAVLITSAPSPDLIRRAGELSVVKVLEKPLDEKLLLDFIACATPSDHRRNGSARCPKEPRR